MKSLVMKFLCGLLLSAAFTISATGQTDLAGTWQGELEAAPGSKLKIQFVVTGKPGGGYGVVVTSPNSGAIKDVAAADVAFTDGKLIVDVPKLSGGYTGTLRNGVLEGEWTQEGQKLPLNLRPYQKPTLTKADMDALRGEWVGKLSVSGIELAMVLRFSNADDGTFRAVLDSPDQNARDIPLTDVVLENGELSAEVPMVRGEFVGKLAGDELVGQWSQVGRGTPLTLKKGKYVAATHDLDLSPAARAQVAGTWRGTLGPLDLVVRFEVADQGKFRGFLDVPAQNAKGVQITEASMTGAKLTFRIAAIGAEYTGDASGATITGEWKQVGMTNPRTLKRD